MQLLRQRATQEVTGNGGPLRALDPQALREIRTARSESQSRFWARFGVTQSRGSRFELGTALPWPVAILLRLYLEGVITDGDLWRARGRGQKRSNTRRSADSAPAIVTQV